MSELAVYSVTVHHLAPDAKAAGPEFADFELSDVTPKKLRGLLEQLSEIAPAVQPPASPEMRIASRDDRFLVQVKDGRIRFSSWSIRAGGCDLTPAQILAAITGNEEVAAERDRSESASRQPRAWLKIGLILLAIAGSNCVTAWMILRPAPNPFLPAYTLLPPEPAARLLAATAGYYETGTAEGDRALKIAPEGKIRWVQFGPGGSVEEESELSAQAAQAAGQPALFTSAGALIEIKDVVTLVYYGDTYRRRSP